MLNLFQHLTNCKKSAGLPRRLKNTLVDTPPQSSPLGAEEQFRKYRCAFTLAEVLITLVIIGVIAAITVPSLIAKYKEEELKTKFKKVYSITQQAFNDILINDFGSNLNCNFEHLIRTECINFFETLSKKLKFQKYCNKNALRDGCIPVYSNFTEKDAWTLSAINNDAKVWILNDGTIFIAHPYNNGDWPDFAIDINGFKKPNKIGYDVFGFEITNKQMKISPIRSQYLSPQTGGKSTKEMMKYLYQ